MSYAICLDQNTPNFNLSNLSSYGFNIYSDVDGFTNPVYVGISYLNLFQFPVGNCPFIATLLPPGTTQIIVIDQCDPNLNVAAAIFSPTNITAGELTIECCYAIIDIPIVPPLTFCETCPLTFDVFPTSSIGLLTAGNLTSTCGPVTDYVIGWYLNGNYSSPAFTSGFGSSFLPYQQLHPLTGNSSVPSLAGNYEGIIHDIKINNITYSSVSGSAGGQLIPFESCFDTVIVEPLQCDNGSYQGIAKYVHQINFDSQAIGTVSSPVSITYALNPTTKYFAYYFQGNLVPDEIEIRWKSGDANATTNPSLYSQSIYLEKINIGYNTTTANLPNGSATINNIWPKSLQKNFYKRVLTLTNLETSSNPLAPDLLEITMTPNPGSNNTTWKAGFACLDDFICGDCDFENYPDNLPAITQLYLNKQYACPSQRIQLQLTGCLASGDWMSQGDPLSGLGGSLIDSNKGMGNYNAQSSPPYTSLSPVASCGTGGSSNDYTCAPSNNNTITFTKSLGLLKIEFNNISDYNHYKTDLILKANTLISVSPAITTNPVVCNSALPIPDLLQYYRFITLRTPIQSPNVDCGDSSTQYSYRFHINDYFNITYTENPVSNYWAIDIPQTVITNCYPPTSCDGCYSLISAPVNGTVSSYNNEVLNSGPNIGGTVSPIFTTNVGAKYIEPFLIRYVGFYYTTLEGTGSLCENQFNCVNYFSWYSTTTMPFVPNPSTPGTWTNLTTLAASLPCSLNPYFPDLYNDPNYNLLYYGYTTWYKSIFLSLSSSFNYNFNGGQSTDDFEIYTLTGLGATGSISPTYNNCPNDPSELIYSYIGGVSTVVQPNFFVNGSPTLIIDP